MDGRSPKDGPGLCVVFSPRSRVIVPIQSKSHCSSMMKSVERLQCSRSIKYYERYSPESKSTVMQREEHGIWGKDPTTVV